MYDLIEKIKTYYKIEKTDNICDYMLDSDCILYYLTIDNVLIPLSDKKIYFKFDEEYNNEEEFKRLILFQKIIETTGKEIYQKYYNIPYEEIELIGKNYNLKILNYINDKKQEIGIEKIEIINTENYEKNSIINEDVAYKTYSICPYPNIYVKRIGYFDYLVEITFRKNQKYKIIKTVFNNPVTKECLKTFLHIIDIENYFEEEFFNKQKLIKNKNNINNIFEELF